MYVIKKEKMKVPMKAFAKDGDIELGAIEQMERVSSLPFAFHHTALMPDGHLGYGACIGAVVALKGVVCPSIVGVDIGCGMCAVKTSLPTITQENIKKIMGGIRSKIPVGFNHHSKKQDEKWMPKKINYAANLPRVNEQYDSALKQVGTLGGGNHFIEIQQGSDGYIWLMVHSGSRNIGYKVAKHYNDLAVKLNEKWFSQIPKKWELAFFPLDSREGQDYCAEMNYCIDFALSSRMLMMERIKESVSDALIDVKYDDLINIAHNYAVMEHHFGKNVMVHRKGATKAQLGQLGIIPGSQGTASYIVEGLGNKESFESCSHGAGRKMSRTQARATLDIKKETTLLDNLGVIHSIRNKKDLDEAAGAYKDIEIVMGNQLDLVRVRVELSPLAVIKG